MEKPSLNMEASQLYALLKKYWLVPVFALLVVALFLAGSWYGKSKVDSQTSAGGRRILHYVDPMNPAHTSTEPGLAPCGMKMEPVYADDGGQAPTSAMLPGSVKITPEKQQIIGVRVAEVAKSPWTYTLRTVGKVAADETRTYRVNAFSDGFITRVFDISTGSLVRRDEPLAMFYSKDLFTALQTYYYAVYALDNLQQGQAVPASQRHYLEAQKRAAEYALMNLGMTTQQIKDLIRSKEITQEIIITAPATSFVLSRNVSPGQKFVSGEELFRLADLSRVWIQADLFKNEAKYVRPGEKVKVTLADHDESYTATVSEVLPEFDPATLTIKVRLELDNPHFDLRPGMFVDVEFPIKIPPTINIPVDAIMDSGLKKMVFIARDHGFFEPRQVKTGWRLGDRAEIVAGLKPGERIVVSGNFLIDSESRMKLAAAGMFGEVAKDPVCGMPVDAGKSKAGGFQGTYKNQTYYFCSAECKGHFDNNPARYAAKPDESQKTASGAAARQEQGAQAAKPKDLVCGHEIDAAQAQAAGLTSTYKGKTYYFCSYRCNKQFDKDPERYLHPKAQAESGGSPAPVVPQTVRDPVCGLQVATGAAKQAGRTSEYQGKLYYFDTDGCKARFDKDPIHYLSTSTKVEKPYKYPEAPASPEVPTNPDLLLRLRRDSIRAIPPGKNLEPAPPPRPAAPMAHPGMAPGSPMAMPPGGAPAAPPAVKPAVPQPAVPPTPAVKSSPPPAATPGAPPAAPAPSAAPATPAPPSPPPGGGGHQHD
jgi:membrane fusion protein, copper/silver efflux system